MHQRGSEAHHVPVRILRAEDATFKTGVDDHDLGLLAEFVLVDLLHQVEDGRVDVGLPTRIVTGGVGLSAIVGEVLADLLGQLVLGGVDEAAGQRSGRDLAVVHLPCGQRWCLQSLPTWR